jgi:hypothetical protein
VVDEHLLVECIAELGGVVRRPEPAPEHQVGTRRDRGDRVVLDEGQVAHHVERVIGPRHVEQLGLHHDPARVGLGQLVRVHGVTLGRRADSCAP